MYENERCIIIDESGNLGKSGRYFVIACVDTVQAKSLHNIIKRKLKDAKTIFPNLTKHANEIKAKDAYPCVKYHILECINKKDLKISYIVVDLKYIKPKLLEDKNILYNYLTRILLDKLITQEDNGTKINIICDNKTTKIASGNSLEEYIKLHFIYDRNFDIDFNVISLDSDSGGAFIVQAADYVANSIYTYYEYGKKLYMDKLKESMEYEEKFPFSKFSK